MAGVLDSKGDAPCGREVAFDEEAANLLSCPAMTPHVLTFSSQTSRGSGSLGHKVALAVAVALLLFAGAATLATAPWGGRGGEGDAARVAATQVLVEKQPYACSQGIEQWDTAWSAEKQAFCCEHAGTGCAAKEFHDLHAAEQLYTGFDCNDTYNWEKSWAPLKKKECCERKHVGCGSPPLWRTIGFVVGVLFLVLILLAIGFFAYRRLTKPGPKTAQPKPPVPTKLDSKELRRKPEATVHAPRARGVCPAPTLTTMKQEKERSV